MVSSGYIDILTLNAILFQVLLHISRLIVFSHEAHLPLEDTQFIITHLCIRLIAIMQFYASKP